MILPILGLLAGLAIGFLAPVNIPLASAKLFSVALLAALDAVFGGLRAAADEKFDNEVFLSGFFSNALMAMRKSSAESWPENTRALRHAMSAAAESVNNPDGAFISSATM